MSGTCGASLTAIVAAMMGRFTQSLLLGAGIQFVCALVPAEYAQRVVALRAALSSDPVLGAIYDPPFVHCTLQLAEEYDWDGLTGALADFARNWQPFEVATNGLFAFTGKATAIAIAPGKDRRFAEYHAAVWETITPYAQGRVDPFYHPDRWVPHITIKRCGPHSASFGAAMQQLAREDFGSTITIDNVAVQHDPGKNSLTHYLRLRFCFAGTASPAGRDAAQSQMTATIQELRESRDAAGPPAWMAKIVRDDGRALEQCWDAPTLTGLRPSPTRCTGEGVVDKKRPRLRWGNGVR